MCKWCKHKATEYIHVRSVQQCAGEVSSLTSKPWFRSDRGDLSDRSSSLSTKVFPSRGFRELDSEERERYKQHTVRITFKKASYESVNEFAALIRKESPFMFLSEVELEPNYPPKNRPYETITYDAVFHVSSVEFADG